MLALVTSVAYIAVLSPICVLAWCLLGLAHDYDRHPGVLLSLNRLDVRR